MKMLPQEAITLQLRRQPIGYHFLSILFLESAKELVPDDKYIPIILIQVTLIGCMMDPVVTGRYKNIFQEPQLADQPRMNKERIEAVDQQHARDHRRGET